MDTAEKNEYPTPKRSTRLSISCRAKTLRKSSVKKTPKKTPKTMHAAIFIKMENLVEYKNRKDEKANYLMGISAKD